MSMPAYEVVTENAKGEKVTRRYACRCSWDCSKGYGWIARAPLAASFPDEACECACHEFGKECREASNRVEMNQW
jgi:hypothetical protein